MPKADKEQRRADNRQYHKDRRERLRGTDELRAEDSAKQKARLVKLRAWIAEYKVTNGCVDCGYNEHPAALDFDHVGDMKTANVSKLRTLKRVMAEIDHCVVRCANCHRIATFKRMKFSETD